MQKETCYLEEVIAIHPVVIQALATERFWTNVRNVVAIVMCVSGTIFNIMQSKHILYNYKYAFFITL